jgi:uncharacterized protein
MTVKDNPSAGRYEMDVNGHLAVAEYRLQGSQIFINHVETPEALRGQGVAAKVMAGVVEDAAARGLTIVPVCSYAAAYMKRHSGK